MTSLDVLMDGEGLPRRLLASAPSKDGPVMRLAEPGDVAVGALGAAGVPAGERWRFRVAVSPSWRVSAGAAVSAGEVVTVGPAGTVVPAGGSPAGWAGLALDDGAEGDVVRVAPLRGVVGSAGAPADGDEGEAPVVALSSAAKVADVTADLNLVIGALHERGILGR